MENRSHTNEYNPKLAAFLNKIIDEKELAQSLRRAAYLIAMSFIRSEETTNPMCPKWTDDSFYYLNELAECLDPVLENK